MFVTLALSRYYFHVLCIPRYRFIMKQKLKELFLFLYCFSTLEVDKFNLVYRKFCNYILCLLSLTTAVLQQNEWILHV